MTAQHPGNQPLQSLEEWEEDVIRRYPEEASANSEFTDSSKPRDAFRNYDSDARPSVKEFYRLNHRHQTVDFVRRKREQYLGLDRRKMGFGKRLSS